jgi:hypothetical protein
MPNESDWRDLELRVKLAAERTDARLASRVSSLTSLTDAEVQAILPTQGDVASYARLMAIVTASTDEMVKVQQLKDNIGQFAGVIVKVFSSVR